MLYCLGMSSIINSYLFGYCTQYQAVLDRAGVLGYTVPDSGDRRKQDTFMRGIVDNGIFTQLDALKVFIKHSNNQNFTRIDWIDPTRTLCDYVNSPDLNNLTGVAGSNFAPPFVYVNTNVTPSLLTKYTQNNCSMFHYATHYEVGNRQVYGVQHPAGTSAGFGFFTGPTGVLGNLNGSYGYTSTGSFLTTLGLCLNRRTASNSGEIIQNGTSTAYTNASVGRPSMPVWIGALDNGGSGFDNSASRSALWGAGNSLAGLEPALRSVCDTFYNS